MTTNATGLHVTDTHAYLYDRNGTYIADHPLASGVLGALNANPTDAGDVRARKWVMSLGYRVVGNEPAGRVAARPRVRSACRTQENRPTSTARLPTTHRSANPPDSGCATASTIAPPTTAGWTNGRATSSSTCVASIPARRRHRVRRLRARRPPHRRRLALCRRQRRAVPRGGRQRIQRGQVADRDDVARDARHAAAGPDRRLNYTHHPPHPNRSTMSDNYAPGRDVITTHDRRPRHHRTTRRPRRRCRHPRRSADPHRPRRSSPTAPRLTWPGAGRIERIDDDNDALSVWNVSASACSTTRSA